MKKGHPSLSNIFYIVYCSAQFRKLSKFLHMKNCYLLLSKVRAAH